MPPRGWSGPRIPLAERMLTKTDRLYGDPPAHAPELRRCWIWQGALNADGYGVIRAEKQADGTQPLVLAHRMALSLALGRDLDDDMYAMHLCDNTRCVRPRHLREGTAQQNHDDMVAKGRDNGWERRRPKLRVIG